MYRNKALMGYIDEAELTNKFPFVTTFNFGPQIVYTHNR